MNPLKKIFQFYINSSIHVALAATALTWVTAEELQLESKSNVLGLVFCSTISAYNFIKYFGLAQTHHRNYTSQLKRVIWLSILATALSIWLCFSLAQSALFVMLLTGVISFLYAIPIGFRHQFLRGRNLRAVSGLKIFIIGLVWTLITVVLPLMDNLTSFGTTEFLYGLQRFVFILVLMLPFDIRDTAYDELKLATIPQILGLFWTKIAGAVGIGFVVWVSFSLQMQRLPVLTTNLLLLAALLYSNPRRSFNFSAFWVEALPMVWFVLLGLSQI